MTFNINTFDIVKYDEVLERGLCNDIGDPDGQMCIEAAICYVLGLPHDDDPQCVAQAVRRYKISLNDHKWSSPKARAEGLRDLGLAQLGSLGVVNDVEFVKRLTELHIKVLVPTLIREVFPEDKELLAAADRCEQEGSKESATTAAVAAAAATYADTATAADAASYAADTADAASYAASYAINAADAASYAVNAATTASYAADAATVDPDKYLKLSASLALQVLKELNSPGCQLL